MKVSALRFSLMVCVMLLLSIMPLMAPLNFFRPFWILLLVMYLQCTLPKQCSVIFILALGLILDALGVGALGLQAFALLFVAFVVSKRAQRFRLFPMSQQLFGVLIFSGLYQLILVCIQAIFGYPIAGFGVLGPVVMTVLCWPWMQYFGDRLFFAPVR